MAIENLYELIENFREANVYVHTTSPGGDEDYSKCIHIIVGDIELQLFTNEDNTYFCGVEIVKRNKIV